MEKPVENVENSLAWFAKKREKFEIMSTDIPSPTLFFAERYLSAAGACLLWRPFVDITPKI